MTATVKVTVPGPDFTRSIIWDQVRAYLRARGWAPVKQIAIGESWRKLCGDEEWVVTLYTSDRIRTDAISSRMASAVKWIAAYEDRHPADVLRDIAGGGVEAKGFSESGLERVMREASDEVRAWPAWKRSDEVRREFSKLYSNALCEIEPPTCGQWVYDENAEPVRICGAPAAYEGICDGNGFACAEHKCRCSRPIENVEAKGDAPAPLTEEELAALDRTDEEWRRSAAGFDPITVRRLLVTVRALREDNARLRDEGELAHAPR